jgi:pimeloyl-ACP methyl ester carboxylesterase
MMRRAVTQAWFFLAMVFGGTCVAADSAEAIHSAEYVKIGGIDQWITVTGADRRNPVVLFLHGGPGDAWSLVAESLFAGWEKELTLVQWDQRGAGRTYARSGPSVAPTMTVERMTDDGIEVAQYLIKHLHQKKIILYGGSWGSVLGIRMAHARPDLFHAFVADGQLVNWQKSLVVNYARVREMARSKGDQATLDTLNAIGPPPWSSLENWISQRKVARTYQAERVTAAGPPRPAVGSEYEADLKKGVYSDSDDFSFRHFVGPALSGLETRVDLSSLTDFRIPVILIHGEVDLVNPPELAQAYFDSIRAPRKKFYLVPGSGHDYSVESMKVIRDVLLAEASTAAK